MAEITRGWAGFAAPDLDAAEAFYREVLQVRTSLDREMGMLTLHLTADVTLYVKPDHAPATYTVLNLEVADLDVAVDGVVARGGTFTRYDGFEQDERGIARGPYGPAIAWTTDPAGNVVALLESTD